MRTRLMLLALLVLSVLPQRPALAEMSVLLQLDYIVGEETTHSFALYGTSIDPNRRSAEDAFELHLDGEAIDVPAAVLAGLAYGRRAYSYDSLSGGIAGPPEAMAMCMMGREATGLILSTRYLTYNEGSSKIIGDEMRPVYGDPQNCLFEKRYAPQDANAKLEALRALTVLDTIYRLQER